MAIKRTKWDVVFSNYIRYRDNWTCQRCKKQYIEKSQGLHCSHFYGRRSWATRIEPCNAMALCNIKKKDIATEENYKLLKMMLMKYTGEL